MNTNSEADMPTAYGNVFDTAIQASMSASVVASRPSFCAPSTTTWSGATSMP